MTLGRAEPSLRDGPPTIVAAKFMRYGTERGMHTYFAYVRSASRGESKRQDDSLVVPGS
jgi:hypothetical protein